MKFVNFIVTVALVIWSSLCWTGGMIVAGVMTLLGGVLTGNWRGDLWAELPDRLYSTFTEDIKEFWVS